VCVCVCVYENEKVTEEHNTVGCMEKWIHKKPFSVPGPRK